MIHVEKQRVWQTYLYYVVCDECKSWVKSGVGQFVWHNRGSANRVAKEHKH